VGRDSAVGTATRFGLDDPETESRWGVRFSAPVETGPGTHTASYTMGNGSFSGVKRVGRSIHHPHPSSAEVKEIIYWGGGGGQQLCFQCYVFRPYWTIKRLSTKIQKCVNKGHTILKVNSKHCTRFLLWTVMAIYGLLTATPVLMNSLLQSNTVTSAKCMFR
jgi:hypothetical protein